MLRYHMGWADAQLRPAETRVGKRLRARLALLAARAEAADWRAALPAAAAVELVHNFSLIHDDIEDASESRHGRPTLWRLWGLPLAINAGDALLVLGRQALNPLGSPQAVVLFDAACLELCQGQHLDLQRAGKLAAGLQGYHQIVGGKTAALLGLAVELGALAAGAPSERRAAYRSFGRELGMAYQIQDDLLGVWAEPAVTGKPVGEDLRERKLTFPVAWAWEQSAGSLRRRLEELWGRPGQDADVAEIGELLEACGARQAGREAAAGHARRALESLPAPFPQGDPQAHAELAALPALLADRRR